MVFDGIDKLHPVPEAAADAFLEGGGVLAAQGAHLLFHPGLHLPGLGLAVLGLESVVLLAGADFGLVAGDFEDVAAVDVPMLRKHLAGDVVKLFEPGAPEQDPPAVDGIHHLAEIDAQGDFVIELVDIQDLADGGVPDHAVLQQDLQELPSGDVELFGIQPVQRFLLYDIALLGILHLLHLEGVVDVGGEGDGLAAGVQLARQLAVLDFQGLDLLLQLPVLLELRDELLLPLHQVRLQPVVDGLEGEEGQQQRDYVGQDDGDAGGQAGKQQEEGDVHPDQQETA